MNSFGIKRLAQSLCLLGAFCLLTASGAQAQGKTERKLLPSFRLTESLTQESVETVTEKTDGLGRKPRITSKGTFRIDAVLPFDDSPAYIGKDWMCHVSIGALSLSARPGDDPDWRMGNPNFTVEMTEPETKGEQPAGVKKTKKIIGRIKVIFKLDRIIILAEGQIPTMASPIAAMYMDEEAEELEEETNARLLIGSQSSLFTVKIKGEIKSKVTETAAAKTTVTTITLKGDGKQQNN